MDDQNMLMCLAEYLRSADKDAAKAFDYASKVDELRLRIAANGAEPIYQIIMEDGTWDDSNQEVYEMYTDKFRRIVYASPVASGPRYDWTTSGMKQSETGNWVMAGNKPGE